MARVVKVPATKCLRKVLLSVPVLGVSFIENGCLSVMRLGVNVGDKVMVVQFFDGVTYCCPEFVRLLHVHRSAK